MKNSVKAQSECLQSLHKTSRDIAETQMLQHRYQDCSLTIVLESGAGSCKARKHAATMIVNIENKSIYISQHCEYFFTELQT